MSKIKAILLKPTEGDPHGLLREGVCGARPPLAISGHLCGYEEHRNWKSPEDYEYHSDCYMCSSMAALVLAWDGKPVREGCDRADWSGVGKSEPYYPDRDTWATVYALMDHPEDTHVTVDDLRRLCSELGTIVLLDADGKEIPCPT